MREAIALLKRAVVIDPSYSPAAAMIAWCRVFQRRARLGAAFGCGGRGGVRLARRSIEAGQDDPDALWMGKPRHLIPGCAITPLPQAFIDRALMLNPNSAHSLDGYEGYVLLLPKSANPGDRSVRTRNATETARSAGLSLHAWSGSRAIWPQGDPEEAMEWADRSLREQPRISSAIRDKVILCALLDRIEEARDWVSRLLEVQPGLTIATYKEYAATYFPPEITAVRVEGLRKAGLPEE